MQLTTTRTVLSAAALIFLTSGLGRAVWQSIQRLEAGAGFEAGIGIVILAVILDRSTQALAARDRPPGTA